MPNTDPPFVPVVFTAFANPKSDLTNLTREQNGIQDVLLSLEKQGKVKKHLLRTDTDLNAYFDFLREWKNEIAIFHYAGHADSEGLSLQNAHTFFAPLANELYTRNKDCLQLVFLNGCSTHQHVKTLFELGVKAVIATSVSIEDDLATRFAIRFYGNLAKDDDLETAYTSAANYAKGMRKEPDPRLEHFGSIVRGLALYEEPLNAFPWALYVQEGSELVLRHRFFNAPATNPTRELSAEPSAFNEKLGLQLIQAMRTYNPVVRQFWDKIITIPNWEKEPKVNSKAKEIAAYSLVGVLGVQLSKLLAIGNEAYTEEKPAKYIDQCLSIVRYSLDLVNFALISALWDAQKQKPRQWLLEHRIALEKRLNTSIELSLPEQLQLLQTLLYIFADARYALTLPLPELAAQQQSLQAGGAFDDLMQALHSLQLLLQQEKVDLLHCFEAETLLIAFFQSFAFLSAYRMASIKNIGFRQIRNMEARYVHRYHALGLDSKANIDAEKVNYTADTVYTDAVLLYRGDNYHDNINLFPFVIDYHALTFESGTKICFYQTQDMLDESLEYQFLDDKKTLTLEFKGVLHADTDFNLLLLKSEESKQLNLDAVVLQFQEARNALIGA